MITAVVLYDLPPHLGLEDCRDHFTKIAPSFLEIPGFLRKHFICSSHGKVSRCVYRWNTDAYSPRFSRAPWPDGVRGHDGSGPRFASFQPAPLADKATVYAGALA